VNSSDTPRYLLTKERTVSNCKWNICYQMQCAWWLYYESLTIFNWSKKSGENKGGQWPDDPKIQIEIKLSSKERVKVISNDQFYLQQTSLIFCVANQKWKKARSRKLEMYLYLQVTTTQFGLQSDDVFLFLKSLWICF